jgi:hypothetical protein
MREFSAQASDLLSAGSRNRLYGGMTQRWARPEGDLSDIGPTVLHRLAPTSARAISLHVYRPPLRTMGIWDATGLISIMPSAFDVGEDVLALAARVPADTRA